MDAGTVVIEGLRDIIFGAALSASRAMGAELLKMSCFVSQWPGATAGLEDIPGGISGEGVI